MHGRCTALVSCRRSNHFVHIVAKLMNGERIVALVFVLPCERIFALLLFPEDLEHGAIEEQIEAVTYSLDAHALTMDVHLINEAFLLSILVEILLEIHRKKIFSLHTYCFISALSCPLSMIFFLLLIFELNSSTVTSRPSIWNLQMNCFLVLLNKHRDIRTKTCLRLEACNALNLLWFLFSLRTI